jgi:hypothetical protein
MVSSTLRPGVCDKEPRSILVTSPEFWAAPPPGARRRREPSRPPVALVALAVVLSPFSAFSLRRPGHLARDRATSPEPQPVPPQPAPPPAARRRQPRAQVLGRRISDQRPRLDRTLSVKPSLPVNLKPRPH